MSASSRAAYEADVCGLAEYAESALKDGVPLEDVARDVVRRRNQLKVKYRTGDDPKLVALMEARNIIKYGDPVGPDADRLFRKYESWQAVIEAACRPARLGDA